MVPEQCLHLMVDGKLPEEAVALAHYVGYLDHSVGCLDHSVGCLDHSVGCLDQSVGYPARLQLSAGLRQLELGKGRSRWEHLARSAAKPRLAVEQEPQRGSF